jgi:hypothetical protein
MIRRTLLRLAAWAVVLALAAAVSPVLAGDCEPEPASAWAPAGYVCPPQWGDGWASSWSGPGAATNWCTHALRDSTGCGLVRVQSHATGLVILIEPSEWCMCWVSVTGPNGETERLIDLDPGMVAALGLDPAAGLWPVSVWPVDTRSGQLLLPDTAIEGER